MRLSQREKKEIARLEKNPYGVKEWLTTFISNRNSPSDISKIVRFHKNGSTSFTLEVNLVLSGLLTRYKSHLDNFPYLRIISELGEKLEINPEKVQEVKRHLQSQTKDS